MLRFQRHIKPLAGQLRTFKGSIVFRPSLLRFVDSCRRRKGNRDEIGQCADAGDNRTQEKKPQRSRLFLLEKVNTRGVQLTSQQVDSNEFVGARPFFHVATHSAPKTAVVFEQCGHASFLPQRTSRINPGSPQRRR